MPSKANIIRARSRPSSLDQFAGSVDADWENNDSLKVESLATPWIADQVS